MTTNTSHLQILRQLVSIDSVFPHEKKISVVISQLLSQKGFSIKQIPIGNDRNNIIATFGRSNKYLGFYAHLDTVPPHPLWKQNPFHMTVKHNKAYGLGVADMKGSIASMIQLAQFASKNNLPVKLIFGVDEENLSQGAHRLVKNKHLKDVNFIISGESGQVASSNPPYTVNFGRKGHIGIEIKIFGRQVHAAQAEKGENAIYHSSTLLQKIKTIKFPSHHKLGKTTIVPTMIQSSTNSFSVPEESMIHLRILTNPYTHSADLIEQLKKICNKLKINSKIDYIPRITPYAESYTVNPSHPILRQMKKLFRQDKVVPTYASSVADENVFAHRLKIPVISVGPIGGGDHTQNEWVYISSLTHTSQIYKQLLSLYCSISGNEVK